MPDVSPNTTCAWFDARLPASVPRRTKIACKSGILGDWCNGNMGVSKTLARGSIPRSPARSSEPNPCKRPSFGTSTVAASNVNERQQTTPFSTELTHELTHGRPSRVWTNSSSPDVAIDQRRSRRPSLVRDYLRGWFVYGDGVPFGQPGDSGSIVVDEDDCVVAMLVALRTEPHRPPRPEDPAFVVPILDVLDGLGVALAGPDRPCTLSA